MTSRSAGEPVGDLEEVVEVAEVLVGPRAVREKGQIGPEAGVEDDAERVDRRDGVVEAFGLEVGAGTRMANRMPNFSSSSASVASRHWNPHSSAR